MEYWNELACPDAGPAIGELRSCFSPSLSGLKVVTPVQCSTCCFRIEPVPSLVTTGPILNHRGFECIWSSKSGDAQDGAFACTHAEHHGASISHCENCHDFLCRQLSPRMPIAMAKRLLNSSLQYDRPEGWWNWPNVQAAFRLLIDDKIDQTPPCNDVDTGRGIVILGGGKYFASAYITIRVLRKVGCTLPIQLWHLSGEITDFERSLFAPWDCTCVDGEAIAREKGFQLHSSWWKGWQLKSFAIANCSFAEVLYLDADSYPTRNPESLFDLRTYKDRGAIFWPDLENSSCLLRPEVPEIFGAYPFNDLPCESGQLLINKSLCWRELCLAVFLNSQADFTYRLLWGDKDTFPIAWRRLGREYARLWPVASSVPQAVLQLDQRGKVLFQHRAPDKFRFSHIQFDSNHQSTSCNSFNSTLAHESYCFDLLRQLEREHDRVHSVNYPISRSTTHSPRVGAERFQWLNRQNLEASCEGSATVTHQEGNLSICRVLGGPVLAVDRAEEHIACHLMQTGFWEAWITQFLSERLMPGMFCVDVGANYGYYTALFAEVVGASGRVLAIEPQPAVASCLRKSITLNRWGNVDLVEGLVHSRSGRANLWMHDRNTANASCREDLSPPTAMPIERQCFTLDELCHDWSQVDLVKIDAEGAEEEILDGAANTILRHHPSIVLEYQSDRYHNPGRFLEKLRASYCDISTIEFDGTIRRVGDDELLSGSTDFWMLFLEGVHGSTVDYS